MVYKSLMILVQDIYPLNLLNDMKRTTPYGTLLTK